jgi:predicted lactoylglutathione lyase
MLLSREKFAEFAKLPVADPTTHTLALYCFSVASREEVDTGQRRCARGGRHGGR